MSSRYPNFDDQQRMTDEIIRKTLAHRPVPRLSPDFNPRLRARLRRGDDTVRHVSPTPLLSHKGTILMRLYWTVACLASSFILFHIEWRQALSPALGATLLVTLLCLMPLHLVLRGKVRMLDILIKALG